MIDEQNFFDEPIRNDLITYGRIQKVATDHGDDYTIGYSLDYNYFKKYKIRAIDLSKQKALDSDAKAMQQINFTGNLVQVTIFFINEEAKETI